MPDERSIRRVAMLGNHLPRQCGIATFTTDLSEAMVSVEPELDCFVLAMNDGRHQHAYPARVRFELADKDVGAYTRIVLGATHPHIIERSGVSLRALCHSCRAERA